MINDVASLVFAFLAALLSGCASQRHDPAMPDVAALIQTYETQSDGEPRAATLGRLAVTGDPRAAVALGEALNDQDARVRVAASNGLMWHFMPSPVSGGTEQHMAAAHDFWREHGEAFRQQAAACGPRQTRQAETTPDGRPSPVEQPARLVPVFVELRAPGSPYRAEGPITLTMTVHNHSSGTIYFHGWGVTPTDWNAETASIDLTDIERSKKRLNLFRARPRTVPPRMISGQSRRPIPPGGELGISFDARKWTIEGDWRQGVYRVRACVRGLELDTYTKATIATDECVIEIDAAK